MKTSSKIIATALLASLFLPTLALAHDGGEVKGDLKLRIEKQIERIEKGKEHKERNDDHKTARATSTAAAITKQAQRIQLQADTMLSFNTRIGGLIASSSVENKAELQAKLAQYQTAANSAKVEAGNAITGAAKVNASNSTTTNASLVATAKADLKEAKNFLKDARDALFSILRSLWK